MQGGSTSNFSIAIGKESGINSGNATNSIAIGFKAGQNIHDNSIMIGRENAEFSPVSYAQDRYKEQNTYEQFKVANIVKRQTAVVEVRYQIGRESKVKWVKFNCYSSSTLLHHLLMPLLSDLVQMRLTSTLLQMGIITLFLLVTQNHIISVSRLDSTDGGDNGQSAVVIGYNGQKTGGSVLAIRW